MVLHGEHPRARYASSALRLGHGNVAQTEGVIAPPQLGVPEEIVQPQESPYRCYAAATEALAVRKGASTRVHSHPHCRHRSCVRSPRDCCRVRSCSGSA